MSLIKATKDVVTLAAADVGLGNVTNESKATMFTNPAFTGNVGIGTASPLSRLDVNGYNIHTHAWSSRAYTGGSWYRFLTINSSNQGQQAVVVLRAPGGHDSVEIKLSKHTVGKSNLGVIAEIRRLGSYAYTHNITKIRLCDDGTNNATHLEVQFGANFTNFINMSISGTVTAGFTVVDMTAGANGTSGTREITVSDGLDGTNNQTLLSISSLTTDYIRLTGEGRLGIGTSSPGATLDVAGTSGVTALRVSNVNQPAIELNSTASGAFKSEIRYLNNGSSKIITGIDISANGTNQYYIYDAVNAAILATFDSSVIRLGQTGGGNAVYISRQNTASEGAEIQLARANDNATGWTIDVLGNTNTPDLRFMNATGTPVSIGGDGALRIGKAFTENVFTITDGSVALSPSNGTIQVWTLGASRTPTAGNWANGESITLFINDGSAFTVTWTSVGVVWLGGTAPSLHTTAWTIIELFKVGGAIYGTLVGYTAA